jgi:hypothetical protein
MFKKFSVVHALLVGLFVFASTVKCADEFLLYRMQQFDVQGAQFGSRATLINAEAKTISSELLARKCILIKLKDLTSDRFSNLIAQHVSGIIIILPQKYDDIDKEVS